MLRAMFKEVKCQFLLNTARNNLLIGNRCKSKTDLNTSYLSTTSTSLVRSSATDETTKKRDSYVLLIANIRDLCVNYWAACAPSHKMGFRSSAAKNGLPGEGKHEGLVPRDDVLTNGFI